MLLTSLYIFLLNFSPAQKEFLASPYSTCSQWMNKNYTMEQLMTALPNNYSVKEADPKFSAYPYFSADKDSSYYRIYFRFDDQGLAAIMFSTTKEYLDTTLYDLTENLGFSLVRNENPSEASGISVFRHPENGRTALIAIRRKAISCILFRDPGMELRW